MLLVPSGQVERRSIAADTRCLRAAARQPHEVKASIAPRRLAQRRHHGKIKSARRKSAHRLVLRLYRTPLEHQIQVEIEDRRAALDSALAPRRVQFK